MGKATKALYQAAMEGETESIKLLLGVGVSIDSSDKYGWTALHHAVDNDQTEAIELLLRKGATVNAADKEGETVLHNAAYCGQTEVLELLLENDADIEVKSKNGMTALLFAVQQGEIEAAKLLLDNGANIHAANDKVETALSLASKSVDMKTLLWSYNIDVRYFDGMTLLHKAAEASPAKMLGELLTRGADINATSNDEWTALHYASYNDRVESVKLLLKKGADVNAMSSEEETALHIVASCGNYAEIASVLIRNGVDVNAKNIYGWTALFSAVEGGKIGIIDLLLEHGVDTNAKDGNGNTALDFAEETEKYEAVEILKTAAAKINKTKEQTCTDSPKINLIPVLIGTTAERGNDNFVSFDVETTGFSSTDKIVDLAAIRFRSGQKVDEFEALINPQIPIPFHASKVHGITDAKVFDARIMDDVFPDFLEFISDDVLVAHNATFDMRFLNRVSECLYGYSIENKVECTLQLSKNLVADTQNYKLETLAKHFGIQLSPHRAYPDALATGSLYLQLLSMQ